MRPDRPIPVLQLVNILSLGGAEGQFAERVRTLDPRRWRPLVATLKKEGAHLPELQRAGIEPVHVPLGASLLHPATGAAVVRLAAWMRREGVRLVHAQDFYTNLLAVPAARLAGARVIVSRLDLAHWHGPRRRRALAFVSRAADRVQVNALAIRRQLVDEEGLAPARVDLVMNGIDLAAFDRRAAEPIELPVPAGARVVTVVANLHPVKGQEDVVEALSQLAPRHGEVHLVLVGEGERRQAIVDRAAARGLARRVHLLGHRQDVPAILAKSDVLVSSSYAEGLSNSIIEGLAARLPVIATSVGGSPELVRDGVTGLLVPPRAPTILARALERVLADEALRRRLGLEARAFAERALSIERMARDFDALYRSVLAGAPVRASRREELPA